MSPSRTSSCQQQPDTRGKASSSSVKTKKTTDNDGDEDDDDYTTIEGIRFVDYVDESQLHHVMNLVGRDLSEPYSVFTYRYFLYRFPHLCILAVPDTGDPNEEPIGCVVGKIDEHDGDDDDADHDGRSHQHDEEESEIIHEEEEEHDQKPVAAGVSVSSSGICHDEHSTGGGGGSRAGSDDCASEQKTGYIGMLAVSEQYRRRGIGKALVHRVLRRMKDLHCLSATLETEVTNTTAQRLYQDSFGFIREELLVRYYLNWNDAYRLRLWFD